MGLWEGWHPYCRRRPWATVRSARGAGGSQHPWALGLRMSSEARGAADSSLCVRLPDLLTVCPSANVLSATRCLTQEHVFWGPPSWLPAGWVPAACDGSTPHPSLQRGAARPLGFGTLAPRAAAAPPAGALIPTPQGWAPGLAWPAPSSAPCLLSPLCPTGAPAGTLASLRDPTR